MHACSLDGDVDGSEPGHRIGTCSSLVPGRGRVGKWSTFADTNTALDGSFANTIGTRDRVGEGAQQVTHWLGQSLVLSSSYRVPDVERVVPLLERRKDALAAMGAHHVLIYTSTGDPGRVLVLIAIHTRETVIELLRSRVFFDWFDAVGVDDIPAVFAGELVERLDLGGESTSSAPEVMVSVVTTVDDVTNLITHVRETTDKLRDAGVRALSIFDAFDNAREVMMLFQIDDENHARHWLRDSELPTEWMGKAGMGAYPPVFVGRLRSTLRINEAEPTGAD
jgi:hypothetical protein